MSDLVRFLQYRRALLIYYLITAALLLLVAFLTDVARVTALYLLLLFSFALAVILLIEGVRFFRTIRALRRLDTDIRVLRERLPVPADAMQAECYALLGRLDAENEALRQRIDAVQTEQIGYYTLWVHQIKTPIAAMRLLLADMDVAAPGDADAGDAHAEFDAAGGEKHGGNEPALLMQELFKIERYADLALRYAKLSDIASDLVIAPCALSDVVHESVKKFAIPFIYKKLFVDVQPMQRTVMTDSRWLMFILEQVISNAVKYTRTGGVTVALNGNALSVTDTGAGIRAEDLPRIFERGYTGYNGRVDTRASGVGLYLAKKAADALHIGISVRSALGEGTTVTLLLPEPLPVVE